MLKLIKQWVFGWVNKNNEVEEDYVKSSLSRIDELLEQNIGGM